MTPPSSWLNWNDTTRQHVVTVVGDLNGGLQCQCRIDQTLSGFAGAPATTVLSPDVAMPEKDVDADVGKKNVFLFAHRLQINVVVRL